MNAIATVSKMSKAAIVRDLNRVGVYAETSWSKDELISEWLRKFNEEPATVPTATYSFPPRTLVW